MRKLFAMLPKIEIGLDDFHFHVSVGEKRQVGLTIGPRFLSFDRNNDIAHELISPPSGYQAPLSDYSFTWDSREGLSHLGLPAKLGDIVRFPPRERTEEEWDKLVQEAEERAHAQMAVPSVNNWDRSHPAADQTIHLGH